MKPEARLVMAFRMSDDIRQVTLAGIADRHPQMTPGERVRELCRILRVASAHAGPEADTDPDQ